MLANGDDGAPIFVLASGPRCGSTLLQRLLNSHREILIWGEQHGFMNDFLRGHRALLDCLERFPDHREGYLREGYDTFAANLMPLKVEIEAAVRHFLCALFAAPAERLGKPRWGFKEVQYDAEVAAFLLRQFPRARVVHLTRDVVDCFISLKHWEDAPGSWTRDDTERALQDWQRVNATFLASRETSSDQITIKYEDLVDRHQETVGRLAAFLGIAADDLDLGVFRRRLHQAGDEGRAERPPISRRSLSAAERDLLSRSPIPQISAELGYAIDFERT